MAKKKAPKKPKKLVVPRDPVGAMRKAWGNKATTKVQRRLRGERD